MKYEIQRLPLRGEEWDLLARAAIQAEDADAFARGLVEAIENLNGSEGRLAVTVGRLQMLCFWMAYDDGFHERLYDYATTMTNMN